MSLLLLFLEDEPVVIVAGPEGLLLLTDATYGDVTLFNEPPAQPTSGFGAGVTLTDGTYGSVELSEDPL